MEKQKKPTYKQMFEKILAHTVDKEEREFLEKQIALLEKKSTNKKMTPEQEQNEKIKEKILEALSGNVKMTISAIGKNVPECAGFSNQKISALVRQLKDACLVIRTEEKGVAYFTKA